LAVFFLAAKSKTTKAKSQITAVESEETKARAKIAAQVAAGNITKAELKSAAKSAATADGEERTIVKVTPLDAKARREELAQLAGGRSHTEAIAFADSLLLQAETIRKAG
ncbi:MAG: DNA repair protein RecN, partial [Cyanobacteria bacterium J06635_11]